MKLTESQWNYPTQQLPLATFLALHTEAVGANPILVAPNHSQVVLATTPDSQAILRIAGEGFSHTNFGESFGKILDGIRASGIEPKFSVNGRVDPASGLGIQFRGCINIDDFKAGDETLTYRVEFITSIDGTTSTQILGNHGKLVSVYRQVCTNGLHRWVTEGENHVKAKFKNTKGNKTHIEELLEAFAQSGTRIGLIKSSIERDMNTILPISKEEAIALCFDAIGWKPFRATEAGPNPSKEYTFALDTLANEGFAEPTLWGVSNAVSKIFTAEESPSPIIKDLALADFTTRNERLNVWGETIVAKSALFGANKTKWVNSLSQRANELMNPTKGTYSEN